MARARTKKAAAASATPATLPLSDLKNTYLAMVRSRVLDACLADLSRRSLIGLHPPAAGYEAHIYGALAALRPSDWLFPDLRMSGVLLARGLGAREWARMVLGSGSSGHLGHASSAEMTARSLNVASVSPLMGSHLIQSSGAAHAMKIKRSDDVVLCWFGPGAGATGDAHVGLNFAAVYKVPAVFYFCTSGDETADAERLGGESFAQRAEGYGMPGIRVDGSDAVAVFQAVEAAVSRARSGGGPTLIEGRTPARDEGADPVEVLAAQLDAAGLDSLSLARDASTAFEAELRGAVEAVQGESAPTSSSLFEQVFAEPSPQLQEQRAALLAHRNRFPKGLGDLEEPPS
ncbi:MAG: hypothetical protein CL928_04510 [Deltaproteobacteria bacterium]|nr:hypothetical protein [Deltaproteobacteria bacterium]